MLSFPDDTFTEGQGATIVVYLEGSSGDILNSGDLAFGIEDGTNPDANITEFATSGTLLEIPILATAMAPWGPRHDCCMSLRPILPVSIEVDGTYLLMQFTVNTSGLAGTTAYVFAPNFQRFITADSAVLTNFKTRTESKLPFTEKTGVDLGKLTVSQCNASGVPETGWMLVPTGLLAAVGTRRCRKRVNVLAKSKHAES